MLFLVLTSHMHPPERRRKSYKKVNLTKYYNVIVVCVQSVYIFVYSGLRPTVQVYTHCTGLVTPASGAGAPLAPAPAPMMSRPATAGATRSRPVWRGLAERKDPLPSCYFSCCVTVVVVVVVLSVTTSNHQEMLRRPIVYHCYHHYC